MGNYMNKLLMHSDDADKNVNVFSDSQLTWSNIGETVLHTPPAKQKSFASDPRSVTAEICRTPIEVQSTPGLKKRMATAIPKYLQRKPYLETDIDVVMPPLAPNKFIDPRSPNAVFPRTPILINSLDQCMTPENNAKKCSKIMMSIKQDELNALALDPRSPAADFDRTPILNTRSLKSLRAQSQENLCKHTSSDTNKHHPRFSYCETTVPFNVPEIQVLPELGLCADKCVTADDINHSNEINDSQSSYSSSSASIETISQSEDDITVIRNIQHASDKCDNIWEIFETGEQRQGIEKHADIQSENECERMYKDKIKIWRDSLSSEESREADAGASNDYETDTKKTCQIQKEDMIIIFDDDTVIKNSLSAKVVINDTESNQKIDTVGWKKKVVKCENDITVMDRKKIFSPDSKIGNEVQKCRTPLGNRSNNGQKQDLPTKSPQHVLRNKVMTVKRYQENTPPHKSGAVKSILNTIQWDPDSTVII